MFFLFPWKIDKTGSDGGQLPTANLVLIAANVMLFLCGGFWPVSHGSGPLSILLYGFSHAGPWHLLVNMWALWIFGNPVNRRVGHGYYLAIYLGTILALGLVARVTAANRTMNSRTELTMIVKKSSSPYRRKNL